MNNTVILNKDASTWPRIKKYFEERGVDTDSFRGTGIGNYYGVIDGKFGAYRKHTVDYLKAEIIELLEEKVYLPGSRYIIDGKMMEVHCDQYHQHTESCLIQIERNCQNGCDWPNCTLPKCVVKSEQPKEEKKYPRVMWVWDEGGKKQKATVSFEAIGKYFVKGHYNGIYWSFDHASEIEPEVTLEELIEGYSAWKGVSKEQVKVKM